MYGRLFCSIALVAACGAAPPAFAAPPHGAPAPAAAQQAPAMPLAATVEHLLRSDQIDEAQRLISAALEADPHNPQTRFLSGIVAIARKDYAHAIRTFRAMLIDHPKASRVRLELARAYFLSKDYVNADRQFRLVRAGEHPAEVLANIDQHLYAIRQNKAWSWSLSLAIAPDTNLNAATSASEITLSGLPFELSQDARKHSGIGLAAQGSVEFAPRIGARTRLRLGLAAQRREYGGGDFDDMALAIHAGPRIVTGRWDASLLATGFVRWYGGQELMRAGGARIEATHFPSANLSLTGALALQTLDYARDDTRDGTLTSATLGLVRPLNSTSAVTARANLSRQNANSSAWSNWSINLSAGYLRELPGGFTVGIEPALGLTRFDTALAVFGKPRRDSSVSAEVSLLNRRIVLGRFTPRASYALTRQWSNIDLYSFTRHRFEIGLTTVF